MLELICFILLVFEVFIYSLADCHFLTTSLSDICQIIYCRKKYVLLQILSRVV